MVRHALFLLLVGVGIGTQLTRAVEVSVNGTDNKLCLYANLMVNFSVTYEVVGNESNTAVFTLPEQVSTDGSSCDNTSSTLRLGFGDGNSWSVSFTKGDQTYQANSTVFVYNLNDSALFPNATSNETVSVTLKDSFRNVAIDTCYSCKSEEFFQAGDVNQTLWNVLMQAFVSNGSKSENITSCAADLPTTIVAPTTHTSTVTTTLPPPSPTPALPQPTLGEYSVKPDENSTACLLADFGLRVGFKQGEKYVEMNLQPNVTKVRGSCSANSSDLVLTSDTITMMFTFINEAKKFHLHALNITVKPNSGAAFTDSNNNLTLWAASVGSSYMCKKEQVYNITDSLTLFTFDMRVQPFGVSKGGFSTAHECSVDDASILIPIIVGAALAGLILIVVIAYVIGRRKTYVGYQTL